MQFCHCTYQGYTQLRIARAVYAEAQLFTPNATKQAPYQEALTARDHLYTLCITRLGPKSSFTPTKSRKNVNQMNCLQKVGFCHFLTTSPFPQSSYPPLHFCSCVLYMWDRMHFKLRAACKLHGAQA